MSSTRKGKAIMIQGTGSDVGKSVLVAGLCRVAKRRRISVAPFKAQNMSNNAAVCKEGGEIGRAQALQARAAGITPTVDLNPILLKPTSDCTSQVVVHGQVVNSMHAREYFGKQEHGLLTPVMESFDRLIEQYDLVICEGAGSPAEINLRDRDIANMGFARPAGVPVLLVGDIDKGGVIAALVGTKTVLDPDDANMFVGCIVNKFRGDRSLFDDGVKAIEEMSGWPCLGVIPWIPAAAELPAEDAVSMTIQPKDDKSPKLKIAAPMLSRIANFDDADPLRFDPNVDFQWVPPGQPIPRQIDVILLVGTKSTIGDLDFLRQQGWHYDIITHVRTGGHVLGLCGGYQMLGQRVLDPEGVDGVPGEREGLGLLQVETTLQGEKTVQAVQGTCAWSAGAPVHGYEIHVGTTTGADTERPLLHLESTNGTIHDGATSPCGCIEGTYVHGLFSSDAFRSAWLDRVRRGQEGDDDSYSYEDSVEAALDELADELEAALDVDALFASARQPGWSPNNECGQVNGSS